MTRYTRTWRYGTAVAVGRIGMGLLGLLAPVVTQRAALLDNDASADIRIWTRFWATRALALGVGYLSADVSTRRHLIRIGCLVDVLDTAFLTAMSLDEETSNRAVGWLAAITASAAAADIAELAGDIPPHPG